MKLPPENVAAFRLERQFLAHRREPPAIAKVAAGVVALQAQVPFAAELALRARIAGLAREDVAAALWSRRSLVRTWAMRGSVHLVATRDVPLIASALGSASLAREEAYLARRRGISAKDLQRVTEALLGALDAGPLTRKQLAAVAAPRLRASLRTLLLHGYGELIRPAAQQGLICFGPKNASEATFVRTDGWLPDAMGRLDEEAAQEELLRRYLRAFGPATARDFAGWAGIPSSLAKRVWSRIDVRQVEVEEATGWLLPMDVDVAASYPRDVLATHVALLGSFEPILLAYRDRDQVVAREHHPAVFRKAGWIAPTVLVRGRIGGTWKHERRARGVVRVTVEPFSELTSTRREGIEAEAADVARYVGADLELADSGRCPEGPPLA